MDILETSLRQLGLINPTIIHDDPGKRLMKYSHSSLQAIIAQKWYGISISLTDNEELALKVYNDLIAEPIDDKMKQPFCCIKTINYE